MLLTREQVDAIAARAEKATPGPWYRVEGVLKHYVHSDNRDLFFSLQELHQEDGHEWPTVETAEFIITARADVPALCATVRALRKLIEEDLCCAEAEQCHKSGSCPTCEISLRIKGMLK